MAMDIIKKQRRLIAVLCAALLLVFFMGIYHYQKCENHCSTPCDCILEENDESVRVYTTGAGYIQSKMQLHGRRKCVV